MGDRSALRWADADRARAALGAADLACLDLLARLPLLPAAVLRQLLGLAGQAGAYERLDHLLEAGAIAAMGLSIGSGRSARLFHPTDLGLAVLALGQRADPATLARALRLRRRDLLALATRLPLQAALYELLGALAGAGPGRPALLSWRCPYRDDHERGEGRSPAKLRLPACARLAWCYPDGGVLPAARPGDRPAARLALGARAVARLRYRSRRARHRVADPGHRRGDARAGDGLARPARYARRRIGRLAATPAGARRDLVGGAGRPRGADRAGDCHG